MIVLVGILGFYCVIVAILRFGWDKATRKKLPLKTEDAEPLISVIVPVRNEAKNLSGLINSLSSKQYGNYEIIFVDDHSTDNSLQLLNEHLQANVSVLKNEGEGKKSALTTGVRMAKGTIIATTDADCTLPDVWLTAIRSCFKDEQTQMVFGGVRIKRTADSFSTLQSIEFASLIASGAAMAALGFPSMCNGASLAYRKSAFETVNGYEGNLKVTSGDDEFLMRKVGAHFPGGIRFLNSRAAVVETSPQPDVLVFFQQRLRWAGKWKYNSSFFTKALALFIILAQLATLAAIVRLSLSYNAALFSVLVLKITLEAIFLREACQWLGIKWSWDTFISLQFLYPFYVVGVGVASNFVSPSWKGRRV